MNVFLDYVIIDHLQSILERTYRGSNESSLLKLKSLGEMRKFQLFMSDITRVEMLHGLEKNSLSKSQIEKYRKRDHAKMKIAENMHVIWLSYPASKTNDTYSRLDLTLRTADSNWARAYELERELESIDGISLGDARQIVSMKYGGGSKQNDFKIIYYLSEDNDLIKAVNNEFANDRLKALNTIRFEKVTDFISGI
jgi:hypothetical protein